MRLWKKLIIPIAALAVVATACGDDDDDTASTSATTAGTTAAAGADATTTTAGGGATTTGGSSTATTASSLALSAPVKIVGLWEVKGESTAAIDNFEDGAQMALEEINAAGGIGGQQIDYERIKMPLDAAGAETATLQAIDAKPSAMVGFTSSNQIIAQAVKIKDAQIPVITQTAAPQAFKDCTGDGCVGNDFVFIGRPRNLDQARATAEFAIEKFAPKTAALQCVNNPFGSSTCGIYKEVLEDAGVEIVAEEKNEQADTDLSAQVLAIKEASPDIILDGQFPNPLAVFANQLVENDVLVPHLDGSSSGVAFQSGQIQGPALDHLYGVDDCVPTLTAKEFASTFKSKYGYDANYQVAESYDQIYMVKDAVERAGSADPIEIQKALATINYKGICTTYKPDAGNGLHHTTEVLSYAGGTIKSEKTVTLPGA